MTLLYELKKTWVKRRGVLLLLLALAVKTVTVFLRSDFVYCSPVQEYYKAQFLAYMDILEGGLTPEKESWLAEKEAFFQVQKAAFEQANADYAAGSITKLEWVTAVAEYDRVQAEEKAFSAVRMEYAQAKNDARCSFLYTNGWSALLAQDAPDWILVLLLVMLTVPVVCAEGGMAPLLDTMPNGHTRLRTAKLLSIILSAAFMIALLFSAEVICIIVRYGLPAGGSALQSLPQFINSEWNLTLWQAAGVTFLHRLIGASEAAVICFAAALLTKQPVPAMLAGLLTVLLPGVIWNQQEAVGYTLPFPAGFLRSAGFLKNRFSIPGAEFESAEIVKNLPVTEISMQQYRTTLMLVLMIIILLCGCSIVAAIPRRRHFRFLPLCLMCVFLTGCGAEQSSGVRFNSIKPCIENDDYSLYLDGEQIPVLQAKDGTGNISLIRDAFPSVSFQVKGCYLTDKSAYRMEDDGETIRIIRTKLYDFAEETICTVRTGEPVHTAMLGLDTYFPRRSTVRSGLSYGVRFFADGNRVFIETYDGILLAEGGRSRTIISGSVRSWSYENGEIWYTDRSCRVHRYTVSNETDELLDIGFAENIELTNDGLKLYDL